MGEVYEMEVYLDFVTVDILLHSTKSDNILISMSVNFKYLMLLMNT